MKLLVSVLASQQTRRNENQVYKPTHNTWERIALSGVLMKQTAEKHAQVSDKSSVGD